MQKAAAHNPAKYSKYIASACSPVGRAVSGFKRAELSPADPYRQPLRRGLLQRLKNS